MTYYYVHDESGSVLMTDNPPSEVMRDPCAELTDRAGYLRACLRYDLSPEPHPDPCLETRRRIRVAVAAWAYERHADPIMSDAEYDALARSIDLDRSTANSEMDNWFALNFEPHTGAWVWGHPDREGLERVYRGLRSRSRQRSVPALHLWLVTP